MEPLIPKCLKSDNGEIFRQPSRSSVPALAYIQRMHENGASAGYTIGPKTQGFIAIGNFLFFGSLMAGLAAVTLLWRGTALDRLWALNPAAYRQLTPLGGIVGIFFLALAIALTTAGIGWFRRRLWGWN